MIDILGEEVHVEKTIWFLNGGPVHSHECFCIYQCTVFTNNSIQEVTVISQTENEQGGETTLALASGSTLLWTLQSDAP